MALPPHSFLFVYKPLLAADSWNILHPVALADLLHYLVPEIPLLFFLEKDSFRTVGKLVDYVIHSLCLTHKLNCKDTFAVEGVGMGHRSSGHGLLTFFPGKFTFQHFRFLKMGNHIIP